MEDDFIKMMITIVNEGIQKKDWNIIEFVRDLIEMHQGEDDE